MQLYQIIKVLDVGVLWKVAPGIHFKYINFLMPAKIEN